MSLFQILAVLLTSGPIAIVLAGLLIGNHGRKFAMSDKTRDDLYTFWEIVDEILNAVLLLLIGLELLIIGLQGS
jgi:Na+:H+ antiporter